MGTHRICHRSSPDPEARSLVGNDRSPTSCPSGFAALINAENVRASAGNYEYPRTAVKGSVMCNLCVIHHDDLTNCELFERCVGPLCDLGHAGAGDPYTNTRKLMRINAGLLAGLLYGAVQCLQGGMFSDLFDLDSVAQTSPQDPAFIRNYTFRLSPATVDSKEKSHGRISITDIFWDLRVGGCPAR